MQTADSSQQPESGGPAAGDPAESGRNQRYWFHILAQSTPAARNLHAARLVEKAWQQGDRACIVCDTQQQAQELDDLLWSFNPESFIPHRQVTDSGITCSEPVGILLCPPQPEDWDTVIILSQTLPANADRFRRLALVAQNDPVILNQARDHYRQLRTLGIEARVHDQRRR
ncbi:MULTISPECIES: DNA polymerase III subunit chi [Marinobacter]|uniref:DNA polymerase III subunit chi n=1 Tax=Marinobacter suaedae TaxID=3057675 RepID=A0ABT8W0W4_9GAMM|nr:MULTISPECIES: DNA polymerase III subunit chi [unclassified Marinobacter]MBZ2169908.1 DNA polymerase III subunit chi [Marinobacter sp. F4216]MDO3721888.1 DNA polymerase III subunit chi [Marinobacter sp. chi1]